MRRSSPFIDPGSRTAPNMLALVHLSRDNLVPVILKEDDGAVDGYAEGTVINTRFGSFPHSTLINQPWGSQIRASVVDTGSRGRKRKAEDIEEGGIDTEETGSGTGKATKNTKTAPSGFIHILPPTPEIWTTSLPHRTQVVYTPDYSYILSRIRARPGMRIIEAGAGSGSFTHAAVRAVFNGYPSHQTSSTNGYSGGDSAGDSTEAASADSVGKVYSFEFNEDRYHKMGDEIEAHGLRELVKITHRDVYNDGFLVNGESPEAECVFLDLPAPWKALQHLSRGEKSPLRSDRSVYICTFSPCIEQVTKTVDSLRRLGWRDIEMVEVAHKKINVMREKVGMNMPMERGNNQSPYDVAEAVRRLKEVEGRFKEFQGRSEKGDQAGDVDMNEVENQDPAADLAATKPFMAGRLIHRTEPEIKTHTSYLVFAVLPQEWFEEQEAAAFAKWPCGKESKIIGSLNKEARKKEKRELLQGKKKARKGGKDSKQPEAEEVEA